MVGLHGRGTQQKWLDIMCRLEKSERQALDTLHRVRSKMHNLRNFTKNNSRPTPHCGLPLLKEDDYIEEVSDDPENTLLTEETKLSIPKPTVSLSTHNPIINHYKTDIHIQTSNKEEPLVDGIGEGVCDNLNKSWDMVAYYMDRISYHCDCFISNLPPDQMTKADRLHFERFHKALCSRGSTSNATKHPKKCSRSKS